MLRIALTVLFSIVVLMSLGGCCGNSNKHDYHDDCHDHPRKQSTRYVEPVQQPPAPPVELYNINGERLLLNYDGSGRLISITRINRNGTPSIFDMTAPGVLKCR